MKYPSILFCIIFFSTTGMYSQDLQSSRDSLAYSLGVMIGDNLQQEGYTDLPMDIFFAAILTSLKDEETRIPPSACEQYVRDHATKNKMRQYEANKSAGEQFLAKNKTKPGVISLDNGLQYEILKEGSGPKPSATDEVIVHYHGTLIDGTTFDSSVDRGESISFPLNRVIRGWTEILQLMPTGSKWRVYIPYNLAYGDRAAGPHIQPFSTLIFEIELLGIK